jgi:predicted Kef-type K+ transport protein
MRRTEKFWHVLDVDVRVLLNDTGVLLLMFDCLVRFQFNDWMDSLVEAMLALISSKTTAIFCGLAMVVYIGGTILMRLGG